jgi:hypothetical protein
MGRSVRRCGTWHRACLNRTGLYFERRTSALRFGHAISHAVAGFSGLDGDRKRERVSPGTSRSRPLDNERGLVFRDGVSRGACARIRRTACGVDSASPNQMSAIAEAPTLRGFRRVGTSDLDHQIHPSSDSFEIPTLAKNARVGQPQKAPDLASPPRSRLHQLRVMLTKCWADSNRTCS